MDSLGLTTLIDMLEALPDTFGGPRLFEQPVANGAVVGGNVRLIANQSGPATVILPPAPNDGWRVQVVDAGGGAVTLARNGRKILGATSDYAVPSNTTLLMYRADLGDWRLTTITALGDTLPYPVQFDEHLAAMLAIQLAPHYSQPVNEVVVAKATEGAALMAQRYAPRRKLFGNETRFGDSARG